MSLQDLERAVRAAGRPGPGTASGRVLRDDLQRAPDVCRVRAGRRARMGEPVKAATGDGWCEAGLGAANHGRRHDVSDGEDLGTCRGCRLASFVLKAHCQLFVADQEFSELSFGLLRRQRRSDVRRANTDEALSESILHWWRGPAP